MFKKLLGLILFATLLISSSNAMATGNEGRKVNVIQGKVTDGSTFEGLAGVTVEVEGTDIKVFTDFEGNFTLPALPEGSYTLKSTMVSYNEVKLRGIKVSAESPSSVEMKLHSN